VATLVSPPDIHYAVLLGIALTMILHVVRPFGIDVSSNADGGLDLHARGLLWVATVSKLRNRLVGIVENDSGNGPIRLSLADCPAIDSTIAGAIAEGAERAQQAGRVFVVVDPPDGGVPILENFDVAVVEPAPV